MTVGFRIHPLTTRIDAGLVDRFRAIPVANISDSMSRMSAGGPTLRPMHGAKGGAVAVLAGPAFTVKARPGDNLLLHKSLDLAAPGDIIVCDGGGDLTNALIGELMIAHAIKRGLGGVVINGAVRDSAAIRAGSFPVFAAGVTHRGPYKDGPGEINVPLAIAGMVIAPGDLIIGDDDGLLCVPRLEAETIYKAAKAKNDAEQKQMAAINAGTSDRVWIDAALAKLGCEMMG
jgi:RraA family protein